MPITPPIVVEGTESVAEQAPDGTWTIRNVPLFAAHVGISARTGKRVVVNRSWLSRCVEQQQAEYATNRYLPRLHVNHHDWGDPVEDAGYFLPTRVDLAATRGGLVHTIYGDLVGVRPEIYERIRAKRLPYLSPEVDLDSMHLESCALLPTRPPKGKFTPITIGRERKCLRGPETVAAYAKSTGVGARVLTRIRVAMADPVKPDEKPQTEKNGDAPPAAPAPAAAPAADAMTTVAAKLDQILAMLAKLLVEPDDGAPGGQTPAAGSVSTAYAEKVAALEGKVAALEGKAAGLEAKAEADRAARAAEAEIADAEKALAKYGSVIPNLRDRIRATHKAGGKAALAVFADTLKDVPVGAGRSTLDDADGMEGAGAALSKPLLDKYGANGPDVLARVAKHAATFAATGGAAAHQMSELEYVELYETLATRTSA